MSLNFEPKKLWIHCNRCFEQYVFKERIFFLLACQHVTCEKCVTASLGCTPSDAPTYTCPMCKKTVRGRQINNQMPNNLKNLFHPEPWTDGISHDIVETFQRAQMKHFDDYIATKEQEVKKLLKDISLARDACHKLYVEHQRLRMLRKKLESRVHQIKIHRKQQQKIAYNTCISSRPSSTTQSDKNQRRSQSEQLRLDVRLRKRTKLEPPNTAITSFQHQPNHSFDL